MSEQREFMIICPNCGATWKAIGFDYQDAAIDTMCQECEYEISEDDFIKVGG